MNWLRVSREFPCVVCNRPDWCTFSANGVWACCMREHRGAIRRMKNDGYLFRRNDAPAPAYVKPEPKPIAPPMDFEQESRVAEMEYAKEGGESDIDREIGLPRWSLRAMRCGRYSGVLGFPMEDPRGKTIGVRLRLENGRKFCIRGSRNGLFVPHVIMPQHDFLFVCEGGTDCAALTSLELTAIGRFSNVGGREMLIEYLKGIRREIVIFKDRDEKEQAREGTKRGADELAAALIAIGENVRMIAPPRGYKDAREWIRNGATAEAILCRARNQFRMKAKAEKRSMELV